MKTVTAIPLFLILSLCSGWDLQVNSPPSVAKRYDLVARLNVLPEEFNVTGRAVIGDPSHGCAELQNTEDLSGAIVFIQDTPICTIQQKIRYVSQSAGVIGLVLIMQDGTVGANFNFGEALDLALYLPSVEISGKVGKELVKAIEEEEEVIVWIKTPDDNPWMKLAWGPAGVLFQLGFQLASIGSFCFSVWKWREFVHAQSFQLSVPQMCLGLEALAALVRCLYFIQPLRFTKFFFVNWFYALTETVSFSISFTTTLLITFYWQQALTAVHSNSKYSTGNLPNLGRFKIPFLAVIGVIWVLEIVGTMFRAANAYVVESLIFISAGIYVLTSIFCAVFFLITGGQIIRVLKKTGDLNSTKGSSKRLRLVTIFVSLSTVGLVGFIFGGILFISPVNAESPEASLFVWTVIWASLFLISFPQIAAFQPPSKDTS